MQNTGTATTWQNSMEKTEITSRLEALASSDKHRPQTSRLRDIFEDVEKTLAAGVSQADVLAELKQAGFTLSLPGFKSALQRIRTERGLSTPKPRKKKGEGEEPDSGATNAGQAPPPGTTATSDEVSQTALPKTGFHNVVDAIARQNSGSDPRRND